MDENTNAKQRLKKSQMTSEKNKKSATKKKKKCKKSTKSGQTSQSPDTLEVEGVGKFEQTGADSDSSSVARRTCSSPTVSNLSSTFAVNSISDVDNDNQDKSKSFKPKSATSKLSITSALTLIRSTYSTSAVNDTNKKINYSNINSGVELASSSLSNMTVKSKNASRSKVKTGGSKTSCNGATTKKDKQTKSEAIKSNAVRAAEEAAKLRSEESLRWELAVEDEEQERERIKVYKINRRKRYLAAAQEKGLGWVVNYGNNGSPIVEDMAISLPEMRERESLHTTITDFSSVRSIIASQNNGPLNMGGEITC